MASTTTTCFCGSIHEQATCQHCGARIMRHDEPGLMGWFALMRGPGTFADGDCARNAMNAFHSPAPIARAHTGIVGGGADLYPREHAAPAVSHYVTRLQGGDTAHHAVVAATQDNMR